MLYIYRRKLEIHQPEFIMAKSAMIHARLEPNLKEEAEAILEKLGLSMTAAMSIFCRQIVLRKGIPFNVEIPNKTAVKSMQEARRKAQKPGRFKSAESMFASLDDD